jgi:pimeloyl-ACP methyl ester carboxylesterase
MSTVRSADGTAIFYTRAGQGPPLILVDGALCSRSFGPMPKLAEQLAPHFTVYTYDRRGRGESGDTAPESPYSPDREIEDLEVLVAQAGDSVYLHGTSSGAALALEAAKHIRSIAKLAVYEAPFIVDDSRPPMPDDYLPRLKQLVADSRPGDAVKMFMRFVGTPAIFTAVMPLTPVWPKLEAAAPTLPYDLTILRDHQRGTPFTPGEWAAVKVPTLVAVGGKSPAWMTNAARALADSLPDATYRTLRGQNHMVKAQAIAPVLTGFFTAND